MSNEQEMREALIDRIVETAEEGNWPEFDDAIGKLRATLCTEAQPEVTGAVAEIVEVQVDHDDYSLEVKLLQPLPHGTKLYPPSAIEAAVREKLAEAAKIVENREIGDFGYISTVLARRIRALIK